MRKYLRLLEVKVVDRLMSSISHFNIMVDVLLLVRLTYRWWHLI
jgi:hypothetical protein